VEALTVLGQPWRVKAEERIANAMIPVLVLIALGAVAYLWLKGSRRQPKVPLKEWLPKLLLPALALLYLVSPIDLIPDVGPAGLIDDILFFALTLWWVGTRPQSRPAGGTRQRKAAGGQRPQHDAWDPHRVLGVPRGASRPEITRAYREKMKRYHPDRVADLGEDLQRLAHEKTLEIQRAYDTLRGR